MDGGKYWDCRMTNPKDHWFTFRLVVAVFAFFVMIGFTLVDIYYFSKFCIRRCKGPMMEKEEAENIDLDNVNHDIITQYILM